MCKDYSFLWNFNFIHHSPYFYYNSHLPKTACSMITIEQTIEDIPSKLKKKLARE